MALFRSHPSANLLFLGALALLVAEILQVLSFAAPYWAHADKVVVDRQGIQYTGYFGLWRYHTCQSGISIECYEMHFRYATESWRDAVRAMESIAIILLAIPLVSIPIYIYVSLGLYYVPFVLTMAFSVLLGAICNIIGVIIHGAYIGQTENLSVGWCLIICIIGGVSGLIGFIILVVASCNRPQLLVEAYYPGGLYVNVTKNKLYTVELDPTILNITEDELKGKDNYAADIND